MRPHEPEIPVEILRALTPERKLEVAQGLRRTAWEITAAGIRKRHPAWSEGEVQEEVRAVFSRVGS
jgi:hypothetical protein